MRLFSRIAGVWRSLLRRDQLEADLNDEVHGYMEEIARRAMARGMGAEAARRVAAMEIGGVDQLKEQVRDVRAGRLLDEICRDVSYAVRMLRRAPTFTATAVATLALGVGANTAIFSVVHALLLQPLPYADSARLMMVWADQSAEGYPRAPLSGPELIDLDQRASVFEGFGAIWATTAALTGDNEPEQLRIGLVTPDFFSVLGAHAALGRTFVDTDVTNGPPSAILLGSALWQRRYGADPSVVGKRILVNGQPVTVIGVMPATFKLLMAPDASVPDNLDAWLLFDGRRIPTAPRGQRFLRVVGRTRHGVTVSDARADIDRVAAEISKEFAVYGAAGRKFDTVPLHAESVREIRAPLLAAFVGVAILLVIACVNVASLQVARAAARSRETAVRIALGAGYGRVLRQHLIESLLLTALGAIAGIVVGRWGLAGLLALAPPSLDRLAAARVNVPVVVFSIAVVMTWGVILSIAPLSEVVRLKLATAVRFDAARAGSSASQRVRAMLIAGQVAMSVVLVVAALMLVRSFLNVQSADLGFDVRGVQSFRVAARTPNPEVAVAFGRRMQDALSALPGVVAAGSLSHAPYDHGPNWGGAYLSDAGRDPSTAPQADYRTLSPGALELMGIELVEGRSFTEDDDITTGFVVIVDTRLAKRAWPGQSAVGKRLIVDPFVSGQPHIAATVIGVVNHVRHRSPVEEVRDQVYFSQRQALRNPSVYVVKTAGETSAIVPAIREAIKSIDPTLPIYDVRPLAVYVDDARATRAFTMQLAVIFAIVSLSLAAVGIYGVIAYSVALRHREFGVRQALGATSRAIVLLVFRDGARLLGTGLVAGFLVATLATSLMRSLLYGVNPLDPITFMTAVPVLMLTGLVALVTPVRRALRVAPGESLRAE